jgi:metal-sulfur cluster biosynthetic enzyme
VSDDVIPPAAPENAGSGSAAEGAPTEGAAAAISEDQVKLALRRVKDPELNLNILDLGLIYAIRVEGNDVEVEMSLTSPGCPSGPEIMQGAEEQVKAIPGVGAVTVTLVWSPPWTPERIEPRVRAYLGM